MSDGVPGTLGRSRDHDGIILVTAPRTEALARGDWSLFNNSSCAFGYSTDAPNAVRCFGWADRSVLRSIVVENGQCCLSFALSELLPQVQSRQKSIKGRRVYRFDQVVIEACFLGAPFVLVMPPAG
jgi:hypothetical protein